MGLDNCSFSPAHSPYSLFFEILMQGQTPGKRLQKIKVVMMDGAPATIGAYLIRWLFRIVDLNIGSGSIAIVTIVFSKNKQRFGDMLARTVVIKIQDRVSLKDTIYEKVQNQRIVKYQEVKKLNEKDIELIKRVLNAPAYRNNFEMLLTITNKIQQKMGSTDRRP